ncbi:fructose-bisphosphatase class III [Lachnospira multipara]|nr:fructose-bisphosphatase class III [Lachnospira multipara]
MSDIHGQYDMFMELLETINFKETDTLYVLGDVLDRGPHPIKVLRKLMKTPNAICMVGNHELMAVKCLEFLMKEITDMSIEELDEEMLDNLVNWQYNGGKSTIDEFGELNPDEKQDVLDFIKEFLIYEEVTVSGRDYLLVHGGLGNYSPEKDIEDYSLHELIWMRADYDVQYFKDKFVITGHTPTQSIEDNPRPGFIYRKNNHIAIDCGAHYSGGRLAAICLETGEEFYSSPNETKASYGLYGSTEEDRKP